MVVVIDTCSLLAMTKYYLPFDDNQVLYHFIESGFHAHTLIVVDAILNESRQTAKGYILASFPFLENSKTHIIRTGDMFAPSPQRFSNQLDNNLCVSLRKKLLTDVEYTAAKQQYLLTGDARLIIYALNYQSDHKNDIFNDFYVLTEESRFQNDGKLFKKLTLICDFLNINTITLPEYFKQNGIKVEYSCSETNITY